jgi:hypothetical protein
MPQSGVALSESPFLHRVPAFRNGRDPPAGEYFDQGLEAGGPQFDAFNWTAH